MTNPLSTEFPDRLVSLRDGRPGLRASMHMQVREPSDSQPSSQPNDSQPSTLNSQPVLDFISSDNSLDRYDEIITPEGWHLENYRRNPVFQNSHQYGDIIFTLGKALITEVRYGNPTREASENLSTLNSQPSAYLFQRIAFATEVNPMARIAYGLYKHGFLQAVSVGFIPIRWEDGTPKSAYRRKHLEQELLEVSAVAIPANPNALALGLKSGAVDKSDLRELADLCRRSLQAAPPCSQLLVPSSNCIPHSALRTPHSTSPQLISLARQLRDLMRRA